MAQLTLEGIVLALRGGAIHHIHPVDVPTLRFPWQEDLHPGEVIIEGVASSGLEPFLVHATSWRMEDSLLVLSFVVLVDGHGTLPGTLRDDRVDRVELARGDALGPPVDVEAHHVVEHALRHLAWLVRDDATIRDLLPDWAATLERYDPEPFRAFGGAQGREGFVR